MAKTPERLEAMKLRRGGKSLGSIARRLSVSKGTVSRWCDSIQLTRSQQKRIQAAAIKAGNAGRLLGAERNRRIKQDKIAHYRDLGKSFAKHLTAREAMLAGAAIYWCEGSKIGQFSFVNSDKEMVLFVIRWLEKSLKVRREDLMPRVYINELHKDRRLMVEQYWANTLRIRRQQFRPTVFIKRSSRKKYSNHNDYFGLISLRVRRSSELKYRVLGLIDGLKYSNF